MGTQTEQLASRFEQVNGEAIKTIEGLSDAQWKATCQGEQWPVNVTAHHVGVSQELVAGIAVAIATGQPLPPLTPEMLNQGNAEHAKQAAGCSKQETLDLMRTGGQTAAAMVRGLSDDQLSRTGTLFGNEFSAQSWIENVVIGHTQQHMQSIQAAQ
jgi:hypothetical protein